MKTKLSFIFAVVACIGVHTTVYGANCAPKSYCTNNDKSMDLDMLPSVELCPGDKKNSMRCYEANGQEYIAYGCDTCPSGYTRTLMTTDVPYCDEPIQYYGCQKSEPTITCGGTKCNSATWWETNGAWATEKGESCVNNACVVRDIRKVCARGYFDNSTGGCDRCASGYGVYGTTDGYDSMEQDCYIPSGTIYADSTGKGTFTNKCYWD